MPSPTQVDSFANANIRIPELAAVGSTLFFATNDNAGGARLRKLDEGESLPEILNPLPGGAPWPAYVLRVGVFTVVGRRLFFLVHDADAVEIGIWVTDDAHTGIRRVGGIADLSLLAERVPEFTVVGSSLFFIADGDGNGPKLWRTDGAVVERVRDLSGGFIFAPAELTELNGELFFVKSDGAGRELWKFNRAQGRAERFWDLWPGSLSSSPRELTAMGGKLYFTAITPSTNDAHLWVTDGQTEPRMAVGPNTLEEFHGPLEQLTAVGNKLFFSMSQDGADQELWVSDGTEAGTRTLEIQPGVPGGNPMDLFAVGRMLFFTAEDSLTGREPWRSDGTPEGTSMVRDFVAAGDINDSNPEMKVGPGVLLLSIYSSASGKELWSISNTAIEPLTEALRGGLGSAPHGMTIVRDRLYFAATPRSADNGQELFFLPLTQVDCTTPTVECPVSLEIEAASSQGSLVFLPPPRQMNDDSFTPLTVEYSRPSPEVFSLGESTVTVSVKDAAGNTTTCPLTITVEDTRKPVLVCPGDLLVEATSASGASFAPSVAAWDAVSGMVPVSIDREAGRPFPLNVTESVTATAADARGNSTSCTFDVTVKDTTPPRLTCPRDIVRLATSADLPPVTVSYELPRANDTVDMSASVRVISLHPLGPHEFDWGRTQVELEAVDASNNSSTCSFSVYVVDPVAPDITCPGPQQVVASGPEGAVVEFPEAEVEDDLTTPTLRYSAEPGSTFPIGETTVTATASDQGGNEASCSFTVTVTAPEEETVLPGCSCGAGSASASVYWLLLALAPLWARRRAGRLAR
jgi:uncharacterized protein (TIGR03382 family)